MTEAFVRTTKHDYLRVSSIQDARTVMECFPFWSAHHNSFHPHKVLGCRNPREFIASRQP
jgi:putative transposase